MNKEDDEIFDLISEAMNEAKKYLDPADYILNPVQYEKLREVVVFFQEVCAKDDESDFEVFDEELFEPFGVIARSPSFWFYGDTMKTFVRILSHCSAVEFGATNDDRMCISVAVPEIYVRKLSSD